MTAWNCKIQSKSHWSKLMIMLILIKLSWYTGKRWVKCAKHPSQKRWFDQSNSTSSALAKYSHFHIERKRRFLPILFLINSLHANRIILPNPPVSVCFGCVVFEFADALRLMLDESWEFVMELCVFLLMAPFLSSDDTCEFHSSYMVKIWQRLFLNIGITEELLCILLLIVDDDNFSPNFCFKNVRGKRGRRGKRFKWESLLTCSCTSSRVTGIDV